MNLERKKEELSGLILNSSENYNILIYSLLKNDCLDDMLSFSFEKQHISNTRFLEVINKMITIFYDTFPTLGRHVVLSLEYIFQYNFENVAKLFKINPRDYETFHTNVLIIFFDTYFKNIKHFKDCQEFLLNYDIQYTDKVESYDREELVRIQTFFQHICVFNYEEQSKLLYLFKSIDEDLDKKNDTNYKYKISLFYLNLYSILLENTVITLDL